MNIKKVVFILVLIITCFSCRSINLKEKEFYISKGSRLKVLVDVSFDRWCNIEECPNYPIGDSEEDDGITPFEIIETAEWTLIKVKTPARSCEHTTFSKATRRIRQIKFFRKEGMYKLSYPEALEQFITVTEE